jgi:hypothetical protein
MDSNIYVRLVKHGHYGTEDYNLRSLDSIIKCYVMLYIG